MRRYRTSLGGAAAAFLAMAGCTLQMPGEYGYADVSDTMRIGCDCLAVVSYPTAAPKSPTLKPPVLINPPDQSVFGHVPRVIEYRWEPAAGTPPDARYLFQHDFVSGDDERFGDWSRSEPPSQAHLTGKTTLNGRFVGAQPGRWRVKATDTTGESEWSEWRHFRFTR
jgi:hypothetical protein